MNNKNDSPVLYTEDTQTPTNVNTTAQAPITKDENGNILEQYRDTQTDKYSTQPITTTEPAKSNTGSGLDEATDLFNYSWETKAEDRAKADYKAAVLESKTNYLTNRQEIESQGQTFQQQIDMQKYSQNQSNEKAGWTGGYILDTERQMSYLKQGIQSQMYGAMELQKYGYDTSLAAARLAYDTNKYDLALEYYNTALSRAVSEAEITGYYVSPEVTEHLNQYSIASKQLNEGVDVERNERIIKAVYDWFESNGVSKQGVETLTHMDYINTLKMTAKSLANFQENSALLRIDVDSFGEVDEQGNLIYTKDYEGVKTLDFNTMSAKQLVDYANRCNLAKQQVTGYMSSLVEEAKNKYLDIIKMEINGKPSYNVKEDKLKAYILQNTNSLQELINENPEMFKDFSYSTTAADKTVYITVDKNNKLLITVNTDNTSADSTAPTAPVDPEKEKEQSEKERNINDPNYNGLIGTTLDGYIEDGVVQMDSKMSEELSNHLDVETKLYNGTWHKGDIIKYNGDYYKIVDVRPDSSSLFNVGDTSYIRLKKDVKKVNKPEGTGSMAQIDGSWHVQVGESFYKGRKIVDSKGTKDEWRELEKAGGHLNEGQIFEYEGRSYIISDKFPGCLIFYEILYQ
jgi:hypothetical protein